MVQCCMVSTKLFLWLQQNYFHGCLSVSRKKRNNSFCVTEEKYLSSTWKTLFSLWKRSDCRKRIQVDWGLKKFRQIIRGCDFYFERCAETFKETLYIWAQNPCHFQIFQMQWRLRTYLGIHWTRIAKNIQLLCTMLCALGVWAKCVEKFRQMQFAFIPRCEFKIAKIFYLFFWEKQNVLQSLSSTSHSSNSISEK